MISEAYRKQNEELHRRADTFGVAGDRRAPIVAKLVERLAADSVLDYGCGKGGLRRALGPIVRNYDPAVPEYSALPDPADVVVCADVMEHVEDGCIDAVLAHIKGLSRKAAYFLVACRPSSQILPDGRNAHISLHDQDWWIDRIGQHFRLASVEKIGIGEVAMIGFPSDDHATD